MKRIISIFIALFFLCNAFCLHFEVNALEDIETFSSDLASMIENFKSDRDSSDINAGLGEEITFTSKRLIVESDKEFDNMDAVKIVNSYHNINILQYSTVADTINAYNYYKALESINYVEPDYEITYCESNENEENSYDFLSWGPEFLGFDILFDKINNNDIQTETVSVAVIDSGVDLDHPLLKNRVDDTGYSTAEYDNPYIGKPKSVSDELGHGTHVSGIIANCTTKNIRIRPYKVISNRGTASNSQVIAAIYQAVEDEADVINLSLGSKYYSFAMEKAVNYAEENGAIVVAAAGNTGSMQANYPAAYTSTIAVSSIDKKGYPSSFTSYGDYVDIAAPGSDINSSFLGGEYREISGTSMATPFVSAAVAMAKSIKSNATVTQIKALLFSKAIKPDNYNESSSLYYGYGILSVSGLLDDLPDNLDEYSVNDTITFSQAEGIYRDGLDLSLKSNFDNTIYYTIDGSIPTNESIKYDGNPIKIKQSTIIKAATYSKGKRKSKHYEYNYYVVEPLSDNELCIDKDGYITSCSTDKEHVYIPDKIGNITPVGISTYAFSYSENPTQKIKILYLADTITDIQPYAFYQNKYLNKICGKSVKHIGEKGFSYCTYLDYCDIPSVEKIDAFAFEMCGNKPTIDFVDGHKVLTGKSLSLNIIMTGVQDIGEYAFWRSRIVSVEVPDLVNVEILAFGNCVCLYSFSSSSLHEIPGGLFYNCISLNEVETPNVEVIGNGAFENCSVFSLNLPKCTVVDSCAFAYMHNLTNIYLPNLKSAHVSSFDYSESIYKLDLPSLEFLYEDEDFDYISLPVNLRSLYIPKLKQIPPSIKNIWYYEGLQEIILPSLESCSVNINKQSGSSSLKYIDLSGCKMITCYSKSLSDIELFDLRSLESAVGLPSNSSIVLSSECKEIKNNSESLIIYSVPNSYAEEFADRYNHTFIPVPFIDNEKTPETTEGGIVTIDAIGYNLDYQWFMAYEKDDEGIAIEGETGKSININGAKDAPFYYCIVTCIDNGVEYSCKTKYIQNLLYKENPCHTGHTEGFPQKENITPATCIDEGFYDEVIICSVCGANISIRHKITPAMGHLDNNKDGICDICSTVTEPLFLNDCKSAVINISPDINVDYGSKIIITVTAENVPKGYNLIMSVSGKEIVGSNNNVTYEYGIIKTSVVYAVKIVDSDGKVQTDSNGNNLTRQRKINCKDGFLTRVIAFFRFIFGITPTIKVCP